MGRNVKILVELGEEKDWNTGDTFGAASWVLPSQVSWLRGQKGQWLGGGVWKTLGIVEGRGTQFPS